MKTLTKVCVTFTCVTLMYSFSAASNFHNCKNGNRSVYLNSVKIVSAGFPTAEEQTGCSCSITSDTNLTVILAVLVTLQHDENSQFPLEVTYEMDGRKHTINNLEALQSSLRFEEDDMIVAKNASDINIHLKEADSNTTDVNFVLQIKTSDDTPEQIYVNCKSGKANDTSTRQDDHDDNEVLDYIEDLCSPHLVILLTSLSAALLIIILIVSIILCCVVPRKQRKKIEKIRQSMLLLDSDTTFTVNNTDRVRPETKLYEDADKAMGFNNTLSVPSPQHYANTNVQYRQSNLYQNI